MNDSEKTTPKSPIDRSAAELMAERWGDPTYPIHGLYKSKSGKRGNMLRMNPLTSEVVSREEVDWVLYPYGEVLRRFEDLHAGSPRYTHRAIIGKHAARDYFQLLVRSFQRLGESQDSMINAYKNYMNQKTLLRHEECDVRIDYDTILFYMRIMADVLSMSIPSLVMEHPIDRKRPSRLRVQLESSKSTSSPYHELFSNVDIQWFLDIAGEGETGDIIGLRDARLHYGATQFVVGPAFTEVGGVWEAISPSITSQLTGLKIHTRDLSGDIRRICHGLFGFMDHIVRYCGQRDERLRLDNGVYTGAAIMPIYGDAGFLRTMLPTVEHSAETDSRTAGHSSGS